MKKIKSLITAGIIFLTGAVHAQVKTVDQSTAWISLSQNMQFAPRWSVLSSEILAFVEGQHMQNTFRIGASYDLNKRFSVVPFGYGYTWNYKYGKLPVSIVNNEHMVWQQVGIAQKLGRIAIKHRLRIEERFMQNNQKDAAGHIVDNGYPVNQYRFRYRFLANVPLNKPTMTNRTVFLNTWFEGFWSWGQNVTYNSINQKRLFVGAGYQFKKIAFVGGYFYQHNVKSNGTRIENNSGYMVQMNYQLNLFSKS